MDAMRLVNLDRLMALGDGSADVVVGVLDGPVEPAHPGLAGTGVQYLPDVATTVRRDAAALRHGMFVTGVLAAAGDGGVSGICPGCRLLVRPILDADRTGSADDVLSADVGVLAKALYEVTLAGARVVNLSVELTGTVARDEACLVEALDFVGRRGTVVVAASGNSATLASSTLTRHPCVIPVSACDVRGRPLSSATLSRSAGTRGLRAPGEGVVGLAPKPGATTVLRGSSAAAPLVTGALALLLSTSPGASVTDVRQALRPAGGHRGVLAPLLDSWGAYQRLTTMHRPRSRHVS